MRFRLVASVFALILVAGGLASAKDSPDKKRDKTRKMAASTLADLYKLQPTSKELIRNAAGYAVFNNMGTNLFLLSTARGAGVAVNSKTRQDDLKKMTQGGAREG